MGIQKGAYDNPSYLVRQQIVLGRSTAGANGTSNITGFPTSDIRIRNFSATVAVAGTSATSGNQAILFCVGTCYTYSGTSTTTNTGTTTLGVAILGTSAANFVGTASSGDVNARIQQGSVIAMKNGTDATGVFVTALEAHIDPDSGFTAP